MDRNKVMTLVDAKNIVRTLHTGSLKVTQELPDSHLHAEAIRLVCEAVQNGDTEARGIQTCIPNEMAYMGLYPHVMKRFDIFPEVITKEGQKNLNEILKSLQKDIQIKRNNDKLR
jgi:hypothetical protein